MAEPNEEHSAAEAAETGPLATPVAMALSALTLTPDSALAAYRAQRAAVSKLDVDDLRCARVVLAAIGSAITTADPEGPVMVKRLWACLQRDDGSAPGRVAGPAPQAAFVPAPPTPLPPVASPRAANPPAPASTAPAPPAPALAPPAPVPPVPSTPALVIPGPVPPASRAEPSTAAGVPDREAAERRARSVLPFRPAAAPSQPSDRAAVAEPRESSPAVGMTMPVGAMSPFAAGLLPFRPRASSPEVAATRPTGFAPPDQAAPADTGPPAAAADQASAAPTPDQPPVQRRASAELSPHLGTLTVEQYAALCAECKVHPARVAQIHATYGLRSDAERAALDGQWRERMAADPELARSWQWHCASFEQWYRQQPR